MVRLPGWVLGLLKPPTLRESVERELREAEFAFLGAETSMEHAKATRDFHAMRISRLRRYRDELDLKGESK